MNLDWSTGNGWGLAMDVAALLGIFLSVVAIWVAMGARAHATRELAAERRREFEIDSLILLIDGIEALVQRHPAMTARVRLIDEPLPVTRWAIKDLDEWPRPSPCPEPDTHRPNRGDWEVNGTTRVRAIMRDELVAALGQRIDEGLD